MTAIAHHSNLPLALAIERHRNAVNAADAACVAGDLPENLCDAETDALASLAAIPCADDAAFVEKLRYLVAELKRSEIDYEEVAGQGAAAKPIFAALDLHLNRADPALAPIADPQRALWRVRLARLAMDCSRAFVGLAERLLPELRRI